MTFETEGRKVARPAVVLRRHIAAGEHVRSRSEPIHQIYLGNAGTMLVSAAPTSLTAQIYVFVPAQSGFAAGWIPVGATLDLDAAHSLRQWLRLTVRTDVSSTPPQSDLWVNDKLTVIKHPPDTSSSCTSRSRQRNTSVRSATTPATRWCA